MFGHGTTYIGELNCSVLVHSSGTTDVWVEGLVYCKAPHLVKEILI